MVPLRYAQVPYWINSQILGRWLAGVIERFRMRRIWLWTYLPETARIAAALRPALTVYHCVDDYVQSMREHGIWWNRGADVWNREVELLTLSDLVLVSAKEMCAPRSVCSDNVAFLPPACGAELLRSMDDARRAGFVPYDVRGLPRPIVGFVGLFGPHLDVGLIRETAKLLPSATFVFLGEELGGSGLLEVAECCPNVRLLGYRPFEELPPYLTSCDILWIPYRVNEFTRNVFPFKAFTYLAARRPLLATSLAELRYFGDWVSIADNADDCVHHILKAGRHEVLAEDGALDAFLAANGWGARMDALKGLIAARLRVGGATFS